MRRATVLAFAMLLAGSAFAQPQMPPAEDHLEPDGSILGGTSFGVDYDLQVRTILKDAFRLSEVTVRMVALPSFRPEYAVGLLTKSPEKRGPPYRIFVLTPVAQIWTYSSIAMLKSGQERVVVGDKDKELAQLEAQVPKDPKDLKVRRCETAINDPLGKRIIVLWRKMLLKTRYSSDRTSGTDGTRYYFGMLASGSGLLAGTVWSPERDSSTGNLVELADTMRAVCEKNKGVSEADLEKLTAELEHRLL